MEAGLLNKNNSVFLNLLRVLASQAVVVGHLITWLNIFPKIQPPFLPYPQGLGVVVFFILSGILIPYSTSQRVKLDTNYSFKEFFIDRFARIYSSLIPCLFFIFLIDLVFKNFNSTYPYPDNFNLSSFIGNIFMLEDFPLHNYLGIFNVESFGTARPLWTLAIEWWIYMWFGFTFIVIIVKKKFNLLTLLLFILFSIVPFYNFIGGSGNGLMLPWLLGCLIVLVYDKVERLNINIFFRLLIILFLSYLIFKRYRAVRFDYSEPYYVIMLSVIILLSLTIFNKIDLGAKLSKLINRLADYSFTLYLIHYSIISLLMYFLKGTMDPYLLFFMALFVSNLISFALAYFTEMKYKTFRNFLKAKFIRS